MCLSIPGPETQLSCGAVSCDHWPDLVTDPRDLKRTREAARHGRGRGMSAENMEMLYTEMRVWDLGWGKLRK